MSTAFLKLVSAFCISIIVTPSRSESFQTHDSFRETVPPIYGFLRLQNVQAIIQLIFLYSAFSMNAQSVQCRVHQSMVASDGMVNILYSQDICWSKLIN